MMKNISGLKWMIVIAVVCLAQSVAQAQSAKIERNPKDNTVTTVTFAEGSRPAADILNEVMSQYAELGAAHELKLKFTNKDEDGLSVSRFTQWYNGIKVEHGSVAVMAINNAISFMNMNVFKPAQPLSVAPKLTEQQALDIALQNINAQEYNWENVQPSKLTDNASFRKPVAELVWVEDFDNDELDKQLHLAYRFDIYAKRPVSRDLVYVDATTGRILLKDAVIKHVVGTGQSIYSGTVNFEVSNTAASVYEMYDSNRILSTYDLGGGTDLGFATIISSTTTSFSKGVEVDAHWGATKVWDYWQNEHSWTSYDNFGSELYSVINYDVAYNNAFWNGFAMIYGNGTGMFNSGIEPLVSLDVCAHEVGHGVCQNTSSLVYNRESGAMNEGFSDIWGAVIENYAAPGKQMWAIGEEIRVGALRSMSNPKLFNDPDCYTGTHWINVVGCSPNSSNDQCGVHSNSGVLNKWFYFLTVGGKGTNDLSNNFEVAGIGVKKAAKIAFAAEQVLSSTAKFADCRIASISAAATLYGPCSREVEAVTRAWYAVGVGTAFVPCTPQIGFEIGDTVVSKVVPGIICPSSKTISIPVRVTGNAPTGGNATVTIKGAGTALDGADYKVLNSSLTFNSGSNATQMAQVSIIDNGDVTKDRILKLYITITPNGSNASLSYTYDTCTIVIKGSRSVPDTSGNRYCMVNTPSVKSKSITPFFSRNKVARTQFIVTAEELLAAGVRANEQITALEFNVTQKNSTQAFANFNLKIDPTTVKDVSAGNPTVTTTYYNGNLSTQAGWNTLTFSTPYVWNGTDNLAIETCFSNTAAGTENDYIEGVVTDHPATSVSYSNSGTNGCALLFSSGSYYYSISKPVIRLVQPTFATHAETIKSSKEWPVSPSQSVYFRNDTSGKLIANVANVPLDLGCATFAITAQGVGLDTIIGPFYKGVMRSKKEYYFISQNNTIPLVSNYELTLFFDTSELLGVNLANVHIVTTNEQKDATMNNANSEIVKPVITNVGSYIALKGIFKGASRNGFSKGIWGRYFISDNSFPLLPSESVETIAKNSGNIRVVNNPFRDKIYISYNLPANTHAQIKLYDVTGRNVLSMEKDLAAGSKQFEVNVGDRLLPPGNYVLQVVTGQEVMTHKMVKQ